MSFPKSALDPVETCVKFQLSSSNSSQDMTEFQIYTRGRCALLRPQTEKISYPKRVLGAI